jgi:hypothetical protein
MPASRNNAGTIKFIRISNIPSFLTRGQYTKVGQ